MLEEINLIIVSRKTRTGYRFIYNRSLGLTDFLMWHCSDAHSTRLNLRRLSPLPKEVRWMWSMVGFCNYETLGNLGLCFSQVKSIN